MKTSKKIEILKMLKQRIAPLALASTLVVSASGCSNNREEEGLLNGKYDYIGPEIVSETGDIIREVSIPKDDDYSNGIYSETQQKEIIPCKKYDYIGPEFISETGDIVRHVSVPNDNDYSLGLYSMTQQKEIIPCKKYVDIMENEIYKEYEYMGQKKNGTWVNLIPTNFATNQDSSVVGKYDYIGPEFISLTGDIVRHVSVPNDDDYSFGLYSMTQQKEIIPCKKYNYLESEYISETGDVVIKVGVPNDDGYRYGLYSITEQKEIIPCKTYIDIKENNIDEEYVYMGQKKNGTWVNLVPKQKVLTK